MRSATKYRKTKETEIRLSLNLDGTGQSKISTGIPFFNHLLELFSRHSLVDLEVTATGDVDVDYHHTVEDIGLVLGMAVNEALGDRRGIRRYGFFELPMDEALCSAVLDLGGRPFLVFQSAMKHFKVRDFEVKLLEEFFRALTVEARMNLHVRQIYGDEAHHVCEGLFKALARAFRQAVETDPRDQGIPSSKGVI
ncbi:MAG: imidazoleglycerol-phosphate dehydratase HisB [Kiritimatiellae bacterium]|nr:imidazoleglycerol-phosphate dehydratase HisB [Kiritimatiellia bacterium]